MSRRAVVLGGLALAGLVVLQVTVMAFLATPVAVPDLVIVAVLAVGYAYGPVAGGLAGVWAGALLDLVPPAAGPLGGWTLVLGLAGAVLGRVSATLRPGPFGAMGLVAVGTGAAVLGRGAVLWFSGSTTGLAVLAVAAVSAGYALVLSPLALLLAARSPGRPSGVVRTVPREVAP